MSRNDRPEWLQEHLDALPRELEPRRDLWPGIVAGVQRGRRNFWVPVGIAASLVLSASAAWFTWLGYQESARNADTMATVAGVLQQIQSPYVAVRADYAAQWPALRQELDPETAAVVEKNLAIIHQARTELVRALEKQPNDPALQQLLRRTLAAEVDLYQRVRSAARRSI